MIRALGIPGVLAVCLLVSAAPARAAVMLTAIEDNNVLKSAATTVQPNGITFQIKQATFDQSNARLAFLKFDLTGRTIADGDSATFSAELSSAASANDDFTLRLYALNAGAAGYDWTQTTITYANRPAPNSSTPLVDTALATLVGPSVSIPRGSPIGTDAAFTFTDWDSFRQSDNTITFILLIASQTTSTPSLTFAASENTSLNPPTLTIAVPEPGSLLLLAGSLAMLGRCSRRRSAPTL